MIEQDDRRFYYFYNDNFSETAVSDSQMEGLGLDHKLSIKALKSFTYYYNHVKQLTHNNKVYLLVFNKQTYRSLMSTAEQQTYGKYLIDVNDFVVMHRDLFPELDNFLGFEEDN